MMLNSEGNLHRHQNRMEEGRKKFEEALKIDRELAQKNLRGLSKVPTHAFYPFNQDSLCVQWGMRLVALLPFRRRPG
jgi:hypothetical protein